MWQSSARWFSNKTKLSANTLTKHGKSPTFSTSSNALPKKSKVVIIGGGVIGSSIAYHLHALGGDEWGGKSSILLEQGKKTGGGTTWHAAGLVGQLRATDTETQLAKYTSKLYATLEEETGQATGFKQSGGLILARNPDRVEAIKRQCSRAKAYGVESHLISPREAKDIYPLLAIEDEFVPRDGEQGPILQALYLPQDAVVDAGDVALSLLTGAKKRGTKVFTSSRVTSIEPSPTNPSLKQVKVVRTYEESNSDSFTTQHEEEEIIESEIVIVSCGMWSRNLIPNLPLYPAQHFYVVTTPIEGLKSKGGLVPILRDPDQYLYFREWSGGLCVGCFEPSALPAFENNNNDKQKSKTKIPNSFEFQLFEENWEHFAPMMDNAISCLPILDNTPIRQMVNGPESFTPDNQYIIGEVPYMKNLYVAAGFNSSGIASAGGAGKALAEWIINGSPTSDLWGVDVRRFGDFHGNNTNFVKSRALESLSIHYSIPYPRFEPSSGRPLRISPLYQTFKGINASFGSKFGWERVNWFSRSADGKNEGKPENEYSFTNPNWLKYTKQEHNHTRSKVSVFDQTSFCKFLVEGKDAERYLNYICANNLKIDVDKVVYTPMLNEKGTYETDVTITRLSNDSFMIISSTAQATRDLHWMNQHIGNFNCTVRDITSQLCVLSVMGPNSRGLLEAAAGESLSNADFPFYSSRVIPIGNVNVRANRLTYVGELGYELYIPPENTLPVYNELMNVSDKHGFDLKPAGYYAIDTLRLEKGYRAWGHDISVDDNPLEGGLMFAVKLTKPDNFIGKEAVLNAKTKKNLKKKLFVITCNDTSALPWGGEAILRNGVPVGYLRSGGYGHTIGRGVGLGYLQNPDGFINEEFLAGDFQIDIAGRISSVKIQTEAPYDPKNLKVLTPDS